MMRDMMIMIMMMKRMMRMRMMLLFPQRGSFPTLTLKAEEPLTFIVHINGHIIELFGLDITKLG